MNHPGFCLKIHRKIEYFIAICCFLERVLDIRCVDKINRDNDHLKLKSRLESYSLLVFSFSSFFLLRASKFELRLCIHDFILVQLGLFRDTNIRNNSCFN